MTRSTTISGAADPTPAEALAFLTKYVSDTGGDDAYGKAALAVLQRLVDATQGADEDLTWGEPGSCEGGDRHYGVPHCIYCLQAM